MNKGIRNAPVIPSCEDSEESPRAGTGVAPSEGDPSPSEPALSEAEGRLGMTVRP